jgi:Tfp pilus assembly protein PilN
LIPAEITIERINFEEGDKLSLRGRAAAMSDIFKFITTLENSPYFKRIETKYTTQEKSKEGKDISRFEINCPLVKR